MNTIDFRFKEKHIEVELNYLGLEKAFSIALEDAKEFAEQMDSENVYSFRLTHLSTTLNYTDFGMSQSYVYKFLVTL